MDGPNVNWKVLALLKQEVWKKPDGSPLFLELGSCGLHIVHGSIGTAHSKVGWNLHKIFSAAWYLMKDCSARRREYVNVTKSKIFPLKFCHIRWVENVVVANRFLLVLQPLAVFLEKTESIKDHMKSLSSYSTLQSAIKDPILRAKVKFFISVSQEVEPFLRRFQSSKLLFFFTKNMVLLFVILLNELLNRKC
jgi:hypothetical protein